MLDSMKETLRIFTPCGTYQITATAEALEELRFIDSRQVAELVAESTPATSAVVRTTIQELSEYFLGQRRRFTVPVRLVGTSFQLKVWEALQRVPFGNAVSYGELARMAGTPRAARAVGNALNKNPVGIIVPCHRVLAAGGKLGGFGMGLPTKRQLLALEKISYQE